MGIGRPPLLDGKAKKEIKNKLSQGASQRKLAEEYNVSRTTIARAGGLRRPAPEDLTGRTFGDWTVLERRTKVYGGPKGGHRYWMCKCQCGNVRPVRGTALVKGETRRCRECGAEAAGRTRRERNSTA